MLLCVWARVCVVEAPPCVVSLFLQQCLQEKLNAVDQAVNKDGRQGGSIK